jgi:hypothetical protein
MGNLTVQSLTSTGGPLVVSNAVLSASYLQGTGVVMQHSLFTNDTPTISSGFGTSPSVSNANGSASFIVNVGTGGSATAGVIGMPTAAGGWNCFVGNLSAHAGHRADDTVMTSSTVSTVTIENQTKSSGAATAWTTGDNLYLSCFAY